MADIPVNESTAETVVVVTANGQTTFAFDFLILHPEQLRVVLRPNSGAPEVELSYPTSFTVDGVGNENGGTITTIGVTTVVNDEFYIWRDTPIERLNDWQAEGDYKAALVNREQDTMFMIMQELSRDTGKTSTDLSELEGKAIVAPGGYSGSKTLPSPSPDRGILWNADGTGFKNSTFSEAQLKSMSDAASASASAAAGSAGAAGASAAAAKGSEEAASDSQVAAHLSEMNARSAAAATGPVIFFDSKADADAAASGLDEGAIVEVFQDEDHYNARTRYRVESSALDLKIYLDILALPSIAALQTLWGLYDGQVARVVDSRQFGHFKWRAGNLTAEVASDPYQGIWVAPTVASNGSLGAWERMVEKSTYDAEWWLPDTMPTNAQVRLNSLFDVVPSSARKLILPRREVLVSGTVILKHGMEYDGAGRKAPFNGQGGSFFPITIAGSNAKLFNISSGNVTGTAAQGEPGGFHISDGIPQQKMSEPVPIENVSARDCHAFNARSGFRVGFKSTEGPEGGPSITVYGSRDTYLENFHCNDIGRIGIEVMRGHGVEIVGGVIRMGPDTTSSGIKRGTRLVGCHNVTLLGTRFIGILDQDVPSNTTTGVSIEPGGQDGGLPNGGSGSGGQDITCEGVVCENMYEAFRMSDLTRNVTVSSCKGIGRTDEDSYFCAIGADSAGGGGLEATTISIKNNQSVNLSNFLRATGDIRMLVVEGNEHVGNDEVGRFFVCTRGLRYLVLKGNKCFVKQGIAGGLVRYVDMPAEVEITIDDNEFTSDSLTSAINFTGDGTVRMRNSQSNRLLDPALWAEVRPPLDQDTYV